MTRFLAIGLSLATVTGCFESDPNSPEEQGPPPISAEKAQKYREQFLAAEEPQGAKTVIEVRDHLASSSALATPVSTDAADYSPDSVVVVGVIGGGMPNPFGKEGSPEFPWFPRLAAFSLVDPTTAAEFADSDHQHTDGEECIWCTRTAEKLADTVATVALHDDADTIIASRADELLGIETGATVVVEGRGSLELGSLKIIAERIYVRQ